MYLADAVSIHRLMFFNNTFMGSPEGCYHAITRTSEKGIISELQRYLLRSSIASRLSVVFKANKLISVSKQNIKLGEC